MNKGFSHSGKAWEKIKGGGGGGGAVFPKIGEVETPRNEKLLVKLEEGDDSLNSLNSPLSIDLMLSRDFLESVLEILFAMIIDFLAFASSCPTNDTGFSSNVSFSQTCRICSCRSSSCANNSSIILFPAS